LVLPTQTFLVLSLPEARPEALAAKLVALVFAPMNHPLAMDRLLVALVGRRFSVLVGMGVLAMAQPLGVMVAVEAEGRRSMGLGQALQAIF